METGVIIQEPVFTKSSAEEAPSGVILDHSSMEVNKVNLSTVLDDEIRSHDLGHNIIPREAAAEVVNSSGTKETEESERAKEEPMKTVSVVEDDKIVKEKASETEKDEQSFTFVHEPESFNKNTEDSEKILSDVTLEKVKEDHITLKPEEVSVEKPVKEQEEDSRTVENFVKETAPEEETLTDGASLHDVETTKRVVLLEAEKEEEDQERKIETEPRVDAKEKEETEMVKIGNSEETTVHESEILKGDDHQRETAEPVEPEKISREEDITQKREEEILTVVESKALNDTEEQEHVLVRDIPQDETLATVDTSTVQESPILKTLETRIAEEADAGQSLDLKEVKEKEETETAKTVISSDEVQESITVMEPKKISPELKKEGDQINKDTEEDEHVFVKNMPQDERFVTEAEILETKEDTEPIMDLKEGKEQEETEKFEEIPSDPALNVDKEEVKDDKINVDQVDGAQIIEPQRGLDSNEPEAERVDGNRTDETEESPVEKLVSHPEAESVEEIEKPSLESPSEVSEETSKTVDERIEEKPEEEVTPLKEGHEEGSYGLETKEESVSVPKSSELGETVLEERSLNDLTSLQDESCLRNEQEKESKLEEEQTEKHEPANEEVASDQKTLLEEKSDEVIQVSSASPQEGETIVEAEKIGDKKVNEEEQEAEKIQRSLETVDTVDDEPVKLNEDDKEERLSSTREEIQMKSMDKENVKIDETDEAKEEKDTRSVETSINGTEFEKNATVSAEEISKNIVDETAPEDDHQREIAEPVEAIKNADDAEKISHEGTGDREKEEIITHKTEEVQESPTVIETPTLQGDKFESKASEDTEEQEHVLVRDMPQIETFVTEAEAVSTSPVQEAETLKNLETTVNETEAGQVTKEVTEPSVDLKEDQETEETETVKTAISSDEVRLSDDVDVQAQESVEVKSKEIVEEESSEEKHENLLDVPSGESEKHQDNEPETTLVSKTESLEKVEETPSDLTLNVDKEELKDDEDKKADQVDGTQTMEEQRGLDVNEPEAEQIDRNITDETEETPVEKLVAVESESTHSQTLLDVESANTQPTLDSPSELSEETSKTLDEKIEQKPKGEVTFHQEGQETKEETVSVPESRELVEKSLGEESCLPNEEEKETKLQEEQIEKHEPTSEEVSYHQQSPVEEKSDEVIQVSSSASPSEEREGETVVEEKKVDEEEQVADNIQKSLETVETVEPHSSLPSSSDEKEHETVSEKIEEEKVEEEQKSEDDAKRSHERLEEFSNTEETAVVEAEKTKAIGSSLSEKISLDQTQAEEQVKDENVNSPTSQMVSEKSDNETLTAEAKKGDEETTVRDILQGEAIVTEAETVEDTSTVQEAVILKTLETKIDETEAVHSPIGGEEESQVTKENTEPVLDVKEDKEPEETETVKTVILSDEVRSSDVQAEEFGEHTEHCSSEIKEESQGREESVNVKPKEIIQEESTQEKDENLLDVTSGESAEKMQKPSLESASEVSDEKIEEKPEEVTPNEEGQDEEKETKLEKEKIEKHESTKEEEDTNAQQTLVEEKTDEVIQVSSASPSEERESENVVESENIEDIKANEEEQVADKIQRSLETVETVVEPHSSFPSPPEEHETVSEAEKIEDEKVKETEPLGDMREKGLEISETKDMSLPLEESRSDGTESSELVAESKEQKPKQVIEILEREKKELDETKAETIPQETHSDVATESHERQEELPRSVETKETTVAQEEQTRDIHVEPEEVISTEKEETKTKEPEDEHVDSSEKNDDETLIAETKKEDVCIKQEEEFENLEAPKLQESKEDKSQEVSETIKAVEDTDDHSLVTEKSEAHKTPSFISELEDQIPQRIEEIHEQETEESHKVEATSDPNLPVETSQADETLKQIEEIHEEETKEAHKVEATSDQNLPVETSQADENPKQIEEIHEEEIKAHKLQEEEEEEVLPTETVPRESSSEPAVSMLASGEDEQVTVKEDDSAGDTQEEEQHFSAEKGESVGETKPDDQIGTSTKATKVEDEVTKTSTLQHDVVKEDENPDDTAVEAEQGHENSSTLPVVDILRELQTTMEKERAINDSASTEVKMITKPAEETQKTGDAEAESSGNDLHSIKEEPESVEKNLVTEISEPEIKEKQDEKVAEGSPASAIIEANMLQQDESGETETFQEENVLAGKSLPVEEIKLQEEHKEEEKVQDSISRVFEVNAEEELHEETREIADRSLTEVVPGEKILIPSAALPTEESVHVISAENQEEHEAQEDVNASTAEKISLQEDHPVDFETSEKEKKLETHEKEDDQVVDITEEKKSEEVQDEKLESLSVKRDVEEIFQPEVKKDKEDTSELKVGLDFASPEVEKEEAPHSVLENEEEIKKVDTSEKEITEPPSEAEKESNEEHIDKTLTKEALDEQLQIPSTEVSKPSEPIQASKQVEEEDKKEKNVDALITSQNVQVQDQSKDFEQEKKSDDLTCVQEDNGTNDSVLAQREETGLTEEKSEVKTELENANKHGTSTEEKNNAFEKIDQEESKLTDIKEEIKEKDQKETTTQETQECFKSIKNIDNATEKTQSETREVENLSSVGNTKDKSKQEDEVPKLKTLKIAEELEQKDGEAENNKESNEPARKSLSDLIQKVKGTNKTEEDATTKPHIEEEAKTEEEDHEDGDEHKDDKTSPDSIVMVEAKDTVNITKTQHKKSQGILSQVKHSISKVKKALTGKSSHTTKPSSPE